MWLDQGNGKGSERKFTVTSQFLIFVAEFFVFLFFAYRMVKDLELALINELTKYYL